MDEREYSVSEAVQLSGVPSHVLRYWEEELQLEIRRTSQGHRVYTDADLALFARVKELKDKGIQLKAIRMLLGNEARGEADEDFARQIREIEHAGEAREDGDAGGMRGDECAGESHEDEHAERMHDRGDERTEQSCEDRNMCGENEHVSGSNGENRQNMQTETSAGSENAESDGETYSGEVCDIMPAGNTVDSLTQFEAILRRMIEDVVSEQNEKLEQSIADMLHDESEELYERYCRLAMQEAAAAGRDGRKKASLLKRLRSRIFPGL